MCSRFSLNSPPSRLIERFGLTVPPPFPNRGVARPTDLVLVVLPGGGAEVRPWGLAADWSPRPIINARSETVAGKATFRPLLARRVVVPADTWTEWRTGADGRKVPCHIGRADGDVLGLAGLSDAQGRVVILTCAPAPAIAHIHDRMPVVLADAAAERAWLSPVAPFAMVAPLLAPFPHPLRVAEERLAQGDLFGDGA